MKIPVIIHLNKRLIKNNINFYYKKLWKRNFILSIINISTYII